MQFNKKMSYTEIFTKIIQKIKKADKDNMMDDCPYHHRMDDFICGWSRSYRNAERPKQFLAFVGQELYDQCEYLVSARSYTLEFIEEIEYDLRRNPGSGESAYAIEGVPTEVYTNSITYWEIIRKITDEAEDHLTQLLNDFTDKVPVKKEE
jgi:hypothetical protein